MIDLKPEDLGSKILSRILITLFLVVVGISITIIAKHGLALRPEPKLEPLTTETAQRLPRIERTKWMLLDISRKLDRLLAEGEKDD